MRNRRPHRAPARMGTSIATPRFLGGAGSATNAPVGGGWSSTHRHSGGGDQ
jgi:hypothetical protein